MAVKNILRKSDGLLADDQAQAHAETSAWAREAHNTAVQKLQALKEMEKTIILEIHKTQQIFPASLLHGRPAMIYSKYYEDQGGEYTYQPMNKYNNRRMINLGGCKFDYVRQMCATSFYLVNGYGWGGTYPYMILDWTKNGKLSYNALNSYHEKKAHTHCWCASNAGDSLRRKACSASKCDYSWSIKFIGEHFQLRAKDKCLKIGAKAKQDPQKFMTMATCPEDETDSKFLFMTRNETFTMYRKWFKDRDGQTAQLYEWSRSALPTPAPTPPPPYEQDGQPIEYHENKSTHSDQLADETENATKCRECARAETELIAALRNATRKHTQAQTLAVAVTNATKSFETGSETFENHRREYTKALEKVQQVQHSYKASKAEFDAVVVLAQELYPASQRAVSSELAKNAAKTAVEKAENEYKRTAAAAQLADKLVQDKQISEEKTCSGMGL